MLTEKVFNTGEIAINYAEGSPKGKPFVFLHGITSRWQGMMKLIQLLEDRWQIFACDLRGHGKSGRAPSYLAIDYFPDITAFIKNEVNSPTMLMGHSGGAIAVIGAAAIIPELIEAVILLDPPFCYGESIDKNSHSYKYLAGVYDMLIYNKPAKEFISGLFPGINAASIRWFEETLTCVDPEAVKSILEECYFKGLELKESLNRITCPVLLIYGELEKGSLMRESDVEFFLTYTRNVTAVQIKDTGHNLHVEQPAQVLEITNRWIKNGFIY
jgi:pimeloyl-ACP methyl ester carboxylesterase